MSSRLAPYDPSPDSSRDDLREHDFGEHDFGERPHEALR